MKKIIWLALLFALLVALTNCRCPTVETTTFIRDTVYKVKPPMIVDSGKARISNDSTFEFLKRVLISRAMNGTYKDSAFVYDTLADIKYNPKDSTFFYKIQPDTVKIPVRDTLITTKAITQMIETPFLSKVGIFAAGLFVALLIALFLYLKKVI